MSKNDAWNLLGLQDDKDTQFVLKQLIQIGLKILNASQGSLLMAESDQRNLRFAMVASATEQADFQRMAAQLVGKTVPIGEGITGMAALTHDIQTSTRASGRERFYHVQGDGSPNSVLAAPMLIGEHLVGVMTAVRFDRDKPFSTEECLTYGMFANVAAVIVDQQQRLATLAHGPMTAAIGSQARKECELVRDVLSFVRARPEKIDAVHEIFSAVAKL